MKIRLALTAAIWLAASGLIGAETAPEALQKPVKLADGVWAMMTKGGSNAGWFLFGDGVVAVDSGNDTSAEDLLSAIAETTGGRKVSYLIVTSNFGPHAGGSAAFSKRGAKVVSAEKFGPYFLGYLTRARGGATVSEIVTLSQRLVLSDTKRLAEIDFVGSADSGGDLVIYLPNEQILFTGDLVEAAILPPLFSKEIDPEGWISALDRLGGLKVKKLVPGYGPVGPVEAIAATRAYLQQALAIARRAIADNVPQDFLATRIQEPDLMIKELPKELAGAHAKNIEALVRRLRSTGEKTSAVPEKK